MNEPTPKDASDPFAHQGDPYWGQSGRYVVIDGQRQPVAAAEPTEPAPQDDAQPTT